jgi:hypothetical protein
MDIKQMEICRRSQQSRIATEVADAIEKLGAETT